MELGKIPPHDIEAEQAVIGSMLTDSDAVMAAVEKLREESFYREDNKLIFEAIVNLYNRSEPVDLVTVKDELSSMGNFEKVGGFEYLAILPDKVPTTANVQKYIDIVEEKATLRKLIKTANEIIDLGYNPTEDVEDIMAGAEKKIFDIIQNKNQKSYTPIKDVLIESFTKLEELYNQKSKITGVPTGFVDLDDKTAGLHGSDLILIAARPAMGKTAFALNIAANAAIRSNTPVAIFNLEMSKDQLVNRILCIEAMVDSNKIMTGKLEEDDWSKLASVVGPISDSGIYIDDTPGISIMEIRTKCRKLKMEKNIGLIVIDYIQLIQGSNNRKNGSREQEIAEMFLKAFDDSEEKISCNCKHNSNPRDNEPCCRCDSRMTNADRIRNMTDEELAEFIVGLNNHCLTGIGECDCSSYDTCKNCDVRVKEWIQSEVE